MEWSAESGRCHNREREWGLMAITTRVVVVGVDDTPASRDALAFAMREAAKRTSVLRLVTASTVAHEIGSPAAKRYLTTGCPSARGAMRNTCRTEQSR
jgi:hypothetical protein